MTNKCVKLSKNRKNDDFVEVKIRVPRSSLEEGWSQLEGLIKESPEYDMMHYEDNRDSDWFFNENELKLLCGVFLEASRCLPMDSHEFVRWVDNHDEKLSSRQYINGFIEERLKADPNTLWYFDDDVLDSLALNAPAVKAKRAADRAKSEASRQREMERRARWTKERRRVRAEAKAAAEVAAV